MRVVEGLHVFWTEALLRQGFSGVIPVMRTENFATLLMQMVMNSDV